MPISSLASIFHNEPGHWRKGEWSNGNGVVFRRIWYQFLGEADGAFDVGFIKGEPSSLGYSLDHFDDIVRVTAMPCHLGGQRYWFHCPRTRNGAPCRRRVRILYLLPDGHHLGCKRCFNLTYMSSQTHDARVNNLLRQPIEHLMRTLRSHDIRRGLRGTRACTMLTRRLQTPGIRELKTRMALFPSHYPEQQGGVGLQAV